MMGIHFIKLFANADCCLCRVFLLYCLPGQNDIKCMEWNRRKFGPLLFLFFVSVRYGKLAVVIWRYCDNYLWVSLFCVVCLTGGSQCESVECHSAHMSISVIYLSLLSGFVVKYVEGKCMTANNVFLWFVCNVRLQLNSFFLRFHIRQELYGQSSRPLSDYLTQHSSFIPYRLPA